MSVPQFFLWLIVHERNFFEGRHSVERFSMRSPDGVKYYCHKYFRWMQYEPLTLSLVPLPSKLPYYCKATRRGSATDQTRIWTIALTQCVSWRRQCSSWLLKTELAGHITRRFSGWIMCLMAICSGFRPRFLTFWLILRCRNMACW